MMILTCLRNYTTSNLKMSESKQELKLERTDSLASQAYAPFENKQVWQLADDETTQMVYNFCVSNRVPSSYQGPIMIDDEIFIIEQVDQ